MFKRKNKGELEKTSTNLKHRASFSYRNFKLEEALKLSYESLEIDKEIGDRKGIAYNLNMIGVFLTAKEKFDESLSSFQKALKINQELDIPVEIAYSLFNIATLHHTNREYEMALDHFKKALVQHNRVNDIPGRVLCLSYIALIHAQKGDLSIGLEFLDERIKKLAKIGKSESKEALQLKETYRKMKANWKQFEDLMGYKPRSKSKS